MTEQINKKSVCTLLLSLCGSFFVFFEVKNNNLNFYALNNALSVLCVWVCMYLLYAFVDRNSCKEKPPVIIRCLQIAAALIFCIFTYLGKFYTAGVYENHSEIWFGSIRNALVAFLTFLGGTVFFDRILMCIHILPSCMQNRKRKSTFWRFDFLFQKHFFFKASAVIFLSWMPQMIVRYPLMITTDTGNQLTRFFGLTKFVDQHPIFYTAFIGILVQFGRWINHVSIGLLLIALIQVMVAILTFVYTLQLLIRLNIPRIYIVFLLGFFMIFPYFSIYAMTGLADSLFCSFLLLIMDEIMVYLWWREAFFHKPYHWFALMAGVLGSYFRKNGLYIVIIVLGFLLLREAVFWLQKKNKIRNIMVLFLAFALPLVAGKIGTGALLRAYQVETMGSRALYAIPIQQVGRVLSYHGDEIDPEDLELIQSTFNVTPEFCREKYLARTFDWGKDYFNAKASKSDLTKFLKGWLRLLCKYPATCLNATIEQNYYLFTPLRLNTSSFADLYEGDDALRTIIPLDEYRNSFKGIKEIYEVYRNLITSIPVTAVLMNQGIMFLIICGIFLSTLARKEKHMVVLCLMQAALYASIFIGPAVLYHSRYTLITFLAVPVMFVTYLFQGRTE